MDVTPDINQVTLELSNHIAMLVRENAILKSIISQQKSAIESLTALEK